jgi:hypothetical protein
MNVYTLDACAVLAILVTADHYEFDAVEKNDEAKILWFR